MLDQLLKRGPGQTVAFMPRPEAALLAETMVAFANADGGTILLGVDEQGQVYGVVGIGSTRRSSHA